MAEQSERPDAAQKSRAIDRHKAVIASNSEDPIKQGASRHALRLLNRDLHRPVEPDTDKLRIKLKEIVQENLVNENFKEYPRFIIPSNEKLLKIDKPPKKKNF